MVWLSSSVCLQPTACVFFSRPLHKEEYSAHVFALSCSCLSLVLVFLQQLLECCEFLFPSSKSRIACDSCNSVAILHAKQETRRDFPCKQTLRSHGRVAMYIQNGFFFYSVDLALFFSFTWRKFDGFCLCWIQWTFHNFWHNWHNPEHRRGTLIGFRVSKKIRFVFQSVQSNQHRLIDGKLILIEGSLCSISWFVFFSMLSEVRECKTNFWKKSWSLILREIILNTRSQVDSFAWNLCAFLME